jgi:hypothetical protein
LNFNKRRDIPVDNRFTAFVYINPKSLEHFAGYATFLGRAYELGPFNAVSECYPPLALRLEEVRAGERAALRQHGNAVLRNIVNNWEQQQRISTVFDALTAGVN